MVWSTGADDAKMLLGIPFPMNQVITDQLAFNLVDICIDNILYNIPQVNGSKAGSLPELHPGRC